MNNELQLVEKAKAGSVEAFTDLVESYRTRLFRYLLTRCSNYADAEDALQDALISAYKYLHTYNPQWRFSTWLYRIAIRNLGRHSDANVTELGELADAENDPLDHVIAASERQNLWSNARRLLNDEVYTAMWLRYAEDMSVKDIASALDRSVPWTKVNLMRGRNVLDEELAHSKSEAYG